MAAPVVIDIFSLKGRTKKETKDRCLSYTCGYLRRILEAADVETWRLSNKEVERLAVEVAESGRVTKAQRKKPLA